MVESIKTVAGFVGDIAHASAEQSTGLDHVGKALGQMDQMTQQNSALVEENAATAKTLEMQAAALSRQVSMFQVEDAAPPAHKAPPAPAPKVAPPAAPPAKPAANKPLANKPAPARPGAAPVHSPATRMQGALAAALKEDPAWQEF
jgi:methyl-accepting chemotaxis protein